MRQVVAIVPNRALYRVNLASYANFSSDFATAEQEARKIERAGRQRADGAGVRPGRARASWIRRGNLPDARQRSATSARHSRRRASATWPASRAVSRTPRAFSSRAPRSDLKSKRPDWAAAKLAALAHTELRRGHPRAAIAAADKALMHDNGRERPIHGGARLRRGGRQSRKPVRSSPRWPRNSWPSLGPTRRSSRARSR